MAEKKFSPLKLAVASIAIPYSCWYASDPHTWRYIDGVDLLIHEAGHWIFLPFGEVMHVAGGSIMQCLMPLLFVIHFCRKRDFYSASIIGFWLSFNFFNVSIYAADAVKMELPLLGGDDVIHDWNWLIVHFNALYYTYQVSGTIYAIGAIILALSSFFSIMFSRVPVEEEATESDPALAQILAKEFPAASQAPAQAAPVPAIPVAEIPVAAMPAAMAQLPLFSPTASGVKVSPSLPFGLIFKGMLGVGALGLAVLFARDHGWLETMSGSTDWPNNYPAALAKAKAEHRPILVSFTGSDWCGACMALHSNVFNTPTFKDYVAKNCEFVEIDIPHYKIQSPALKKQNNELQQRYDVSAFPTVVVLSSKGNELDEIVGCPPGGPGEYIQAIESVLKKFPQG